MTDQIPAEAVEAGARALFEESQELDQDIPVLWDDALPDDWREAWRYQAREVIAAALPFLRPEPSEDDGSTWEQVRQDRGWPTPSAMRRAATSIDELAIPKYGDVLRFVADLCDDPRIPAGFTRRPMPIREPVRIHWYDCACEWRTKYCDEHHSRAATVPRSVLALFEKGAEG